MKYFYKLCIYVIAIVFMGNIAFAGHMEDEDSPYDWSNASPVWDALGDKNPYCDDKKEGCYLPPQIDGNIAVHHFDKYPENDHVDPWNMQGISFVKLGEYTYAMYSVDLNIYIWPMTNSLDQNFSYYSFNTNGFYNLDFFPYQYLVHANVLALWEEDSGSKIYQPEYTRMREDLLDGSNGLMNVCYNHIGDINTLKIDDDNAYLYIPMTCAESASPIVVVYLLTKKADELRLDVNLVTFAFLKQQDGIAWVAPHPYNPELIFTNKASQVTVQLEVTDDWIEDANDILVYKLGSVAGLGIVCNSDGVSSSKCMGTSAEYIGHIDAKIKASSYGSEHQNVTDPFDSNLVDIRDDGYNWVDISLPIDSDGYVPLLATQVQGGTFSDSGILFLAIQGCHHLYNSDSTKPNWCNSSWKGIYAINPYNGKVIANMGDPLGQNPDAPLGTNVIGGGMGIGCGEEFEGLAYFRTDEICNPDLCESCYPDPDGNIVCDPDNQYDCQDVYVCEQCDTEKCNNTYYGDIHFVNCNNNAVFITDQFSMWHYEFVDRTMLSEQKKADIDEDGILDGLDRCPYLHKDNLDQDQDCIPDEYDLCPDIFNPLSLDPDQDCMYSYEVGKHLLECLSSDTCQDFDDVIPLFDSRRKEIKEYSGTVVWESPGCEEIYNPEFLDSDNDGWYDAQYVHYCLGGADLPDCDIIRAQNNVNGFSLEEHLIDSVLGSTYLNSDDYLSEVSNPIGLDKDGDGWFNRQIPTKLQDDLYKEHNPAFSDWEDMLNLYNGEGNPSDYDQDLIAPVLDPCSAVFLPYKYDKDMDCIHDTEAWKELNFYLKSYSKTAESVDYYVCDPESDVNCSQRDNCAPVSTRHKTLCSAIADSITGLKDENGDGKIDYLDACYNKTQRNHNTATEVEYWEVQDDVAADMTSDGPTTDIGDTCDRWAGIDIVFSGYHARVSYDNSEEPEEPNFPCSSMEICLADSIHWTYDKEYIQVNYTTFGPKLYLDNETSKTENNEVRDCQCIEAINCSNCLAGKDDWANNYPNPADYVFTCTPGSSICYPEGSDKPEKVKFSSETKGSQVYWSYYKEFATGVDEPTWDNWWNSADPKPERARLSFGSTFATTDYISLEPPDDLWGWIVKKVPIPVEIRKDFQLVDFGFRDNSIILASADESRDWSPRHVFDLSKEVAIDLNDDAEDFTNVTEAGVSTVMHFETFTTEQLANIPGVPYSVNQGSILLTMQFGAKLGKTDDLLPIFRVGIRSGSTDADTKGGDANRTYWIDLAPEEDGTKSDESSTDEFPEARYYADYFYNSKKIGTYLLGGRSYLEYDLAVLPRYKLYSDLWFYNVLENQWHRLADMPEGRQLHTAVYRSLTGEIFVFGGTSDLRYHTPRSDMWIYNPGNDEWEVVENIHSQLHGLNLSAAYDEVTDSIFMFGDSDGTNAVWQMTDLDGERILTEVILPADEGPKFSEKAQVAYSPYASKLVVFSPNGKKMEAWAHLLPDGAWREMCIEDEDCEVPSIEPPSEGGGDPDPGGCNNGCNGHLIKMAHASGSIEAKPQSLLDNIVGIVAVLLAPGLLFVFFWSRRRKYLLD